MILKLFVILLTFLSISVQAEVCKGEQIKIAVIDTGFGRDNHGLDAPVCKEGHKDFTKENVWTRLANNIWVPYDFHGHGTNIVGLIESHLKGTGVDHCFIILKYYHTRKAGSNLQATVNAFNFSADSKFEYVNYSSGGSDYYDPEKVAVIRYLNSGGTLMVAAGNNGQELNSKTPYYPAMYDKRIIVVGNFNDANQPAPSSNFGDLVTRWEHGSNQIGYGIKMSGTSQATANATGKIVAEHKKQCDIGKKNGTSRTQGTKKQKAR